MNNMKKIAALTAALAAYISFTFIAFPFLTITVMLYSVPLTMLGGWLFRFTGANITTLITIPIHYVLLHYYSDDPSILKETFNPFGIGTQLLFSNGTALLKISRDRYNRLNESLESIVAERTADLENLTQYLSRTQNTENNTLHSRLLEKPYENLKLILETSRELRLHLEKEQSGNADISCQIEQIIKECIDQLDALNYNRAPETGTAENLEQSIRKSIVNINSIANVKFDLNTNTELRKISPEQIPYIHGIVMEAVTNAVRHAKATQIEIGLRKEPAYLVVFVDNDGLPFLADAPKGMGLPLMQYRAKKIGASLAIHATANNRTRVECRIPTNEDAS